MQIIAEFVFYIIVDILLWAPGAGVKKLIGLQPSESGRSEQLIGLLIYLAICMLIVYLRS